MLQDLYAIRFMLGEKSSHDTLKGKEKYFSYRELFAAHDPGMGVGIPCKMNGLLIVDVDVAGSSHKNDGREWWWNFITYHRLVPTYTVNSPSGGFHFYYKLPLHVNPDTFSPPNQLAPGVDLKWNGWVGAPPTTGYTPSYGNLDSILEAPQCLMDYIAELVKDKPQMTFDVSDPNMHLELHRPFTDAQIKDLRQKIDWMQSNVTLSRQEWRDGLFAMKAGIDDPDILHEFVSKWTQNQGYTPGDEYLAIDMVNKAAKHGPIGPGTLLNIVNSARLRAGAPEVESPFTTQEVIDRSKILVSYLKDGTVKVEPSESNAASLIGAVFDEETLHHDVRSDHYIFRGKTYSDVELTNILLPILQSTASGMGFEKFRRATVSAGLDVLMARRKRDPHLAYLKSLRWDGIQRVERFFIEYVGAEDSEYTRLVGKNFWTALAARGLRPGCKVDSMVVIEGHEGIAKSSLVEAIGGNYTFAPSKRDSFENIDVLRQMHQSIVVELPELIGLIGQPAEQIKAFITKPFDHIRALFAKRAMRSERGFVFIGTTNSDKYLSASMGARRFLPIRIPKNVNFVNLNGIKADRDQLFAEGIHLFNEGHPHWLMPKELLDPVIQGRVMDEPLLGPIEEMIPTLGVTWTATDVYRRLESQGLIPRGITSTIVTRIEDTLYRLDCERLNGTWRAKQNIFSGFMANAQPQFAGGLV